MNSQALVVEWHNPEQAGISFANVVRPHCRERWAAGVALSVEIKPLEDARSLRQNAFYWGFVLKHISEQAKHGGVGATPEGWHLYMKRKHLGYKFNKVMVPGNKRPSIIKELRSTKGLSVKKMATYLEECMAEAATDFGVTFPAMTWEEWRA